MRTLKLLLACSLALSATARAGKIIVEPGSDFPTIQSGVDAAGPGDKIIVLPGVYQENVLIPSSKVGLRLKTRGAVVIEARAALGLGAGPGIWIDCADVTVDGFTIQNAAADPNPPNRAGHGIQTTHSGLTVERVRFKNNAAAAIMAQSGTATTVRHCSSLGDALALDIAGDNVSVIDFTVDSADQAGLLLSGDSVSVSNCRISNCDGPAIEISGPSSLVFHNRIDSCRGPGVKINGSWSKIRKNTIASTLAEGVLVVGHNTICNDNKIFQTKTGAGISLTGNDQTARGNQLRYSASHGLLVIGAGAGVHDNRVLGSCGGHGIQIDGDQPQLTGNRVQGALDNQSGIRLLNATSGGLLDGNTIEKVSDFGIEVTASCSGLTLRNNSVTGAGNDHEAGFRIRGNGHLLVDNTARGNAGDGFNILGDGIVLNRNLSVDNGRDGFDLEFGAGITLHENKARKNGAEGIENNASGTIITDNSSKSNRIDFANDSVVATFTGNASGDGSDDSTLPEID